MIRDVRALKALDDPMLMRANRRLTIVEKPMLYSGRAARDSTYNKKRSVVLVERLRKVEPLQEILIQGGLAREQRPRPSGKQ